MKLIHIFGSLAVALIVLLACERKPESPAPSTPNAVAPAGSSATSTITPSSVDAPSASPGTGPAEGGTAIGGMVGGQGKGGVKVGGAPEPTAGDGTEAKTAAPTPK
jgi:hypothetical protein